MTIFDALPMPYNKAVFRTEVLSGFSRSQFKLYDLTPDYFLAFYWQRQQSPVFFSIYRYLCTGDPNTQMAISTQPEM